MLAREKDSPSEYLVFPQVIVVFSIFDDVILPGGSDNGENGICFSLPSIVTFEGKGKDCGRSTSERERSMNIHPQSAGRAIFKRLLRSINSTELSSAPEGIEATEGMKVSAILSVNISGFVMIWCR